MSGRTISEMRAHRRSVSEELSETRRALRAVKRKTASSAKQWDLSHQMRNVSLAIYVLADYHSCAAVQYLLACGRERHWSEREPLELAALVESIFMQACPDEIAALVDVSDPEDALALAIALKWVHEWNAVSWATHVNEHSGAAPSSRDLLQHALRSASGVPSELRTFLPVDGSGSRAKRWSARVRKRWGGRYARIPEGEDIGHAEITAKVCQFF